MWRMIVYAIGIIFQIVILILMVKEARKDRKMRKTAEYLIDELKKVEDKPSLDCWINDPCLTLTNPPKLIWKCRYCGNEITTDINSLPNKVCKCLTEDKK